MTEYSKSLQRFIRDITRDAVIEEETMWLLLFRNIAFYHGDKRLLRGDYAEYVPLADENTIAWIVKIYHEKLVELRYLGIGDIKRSDPEDLEVCPHTRLTIKPINVGTATIDALETLWERYIYREYDPQGCSIPHYHPMMARLLQMSLHLEWAGYSGFATFERKWRQLMEWRRDEYINPHACSIMKYFALPPDWIGGKYDPLQEFWDSVPLEFQERVYTDVLNVYIRDLDPRYCGEHGRARFLKTLSERVLNSDRIDEKFKQPFRQYAGIETCPNGDQEDGNEARQAGDS